MELKVNSDKFPAKNIVLMVVIQLLVQFIFLFRGTEYIVSYLTIDDSYYYFQTAWNTTRSGFTTFDGINPTNGVQFLWFDFLVLLALIAKSKIVFLYLALSSCFVFNALCHLFIYKIARLLKFSMLSVFISGIWFLVILSNHTYYMGMENSLHALVFWCLVWQFLKFLFSVQEKKTANLFPLTILLILNTWTRVDSGLYSAVIFIFAVGLLFYNSINLRSFIREYGEKVAISFALALTGVSLQLFSFKLIGGSFLPVSALIKSSQASFALTAGFFAKFMQKAGMSLPVVFPYIEPLTFFIIIMFSVILLVMFFYLKKGTGSSKLYIFKQIVFHIPACLILYFLAAFRFTGYVNIALVLVLILIAIFYRTKAQHLRGFRAFGLLWLCLMCGWFLYHFFVAAAGVPYDNYTSWYRSPFYIFWILTIAFLIFFIREKIANREFNKTFPLILITCGFIFFVAAIGSAGYGFHPHPMLKAQYRAGKWLSEHAPPQAVYASWNAGQIGYFSDRRVINLDGLINSYDYYKNVKEGKVPLLDYLRRKKVNYIVDYCCVKENNLLPHLLPVNRIKTKEGWAPIIIWKLIDQ